MDKDGRTCTTQHEVENAFKLYFQDLFSAGSTLEVEQSLAALERKVTSQMNERLVADLNVEEISQALNQMAPLKAPGPDGFPTAFFQQNWSTIQEESAFIPGRLISDNVLAAYEAMHSMQTRMWSKTGFMGFKLDLSKAYDRVEWSFLKAAMLRLGFDVKWVQLVMACVTSVQYAVLVEKNGIISGVPTSPRGPKISHLFFANDCIIFCKSNSVEWRRVLRILGIFEAGSGQKVNLLKTSIFFSRNTCQDRRAEIRRLSGLTETNRFDTYLGLLALIGKSKMRAFNSIKEKAIPTYSMSVFLLPASLCKDLNRLMQQFWWKHMANSSGIHWMSWENMGRAKKIGGLGFRDLNCFNKALLAKQGWRLYQNPSSLMGCILKAKYFPNSSFLKAPLGNRPSYAWRSILSARALLHQGLIWRVGNGACINICGDRWIPTPTSYSVQSPPALHLVDNRVLALIDKDSKSWNLPLLQALFNPEEAKVIASIPLCPNLPPDRLIWLGTKDGNFSIRSAYHLGLEIKDRKRGQTSQIEKGTDVWRSMWNFQVPNQIKMFLWRACNDILPTRKNLLKRRVIADDKCPWCNLEEESTAHAIWFCPATKDVWNVGHSIFQKCAFVEHTFMEIFQLCLNRFDRDEMAYFAAIVRRIWLRRNTMVFEGVPEHPNKTYADAIVAVDNFKRCIKDDQDEIPLEQVEGFTGLGLTARDCMGNLLGAKRLTKPMLSDAHAAELMAASYAVTFCLEVGFFNVIFEGDALNVIREAAHTLAKSAATSFCDDVWLEDIPSCIFDIVAKEQQVPRS
ncbi:uncharacterized protein LOC133863105 [Alnus glutinosa]|uniref:uncharacterized protein LOC133863105 n=1 Tax=Alnus glutinosa TaxID=3517 RepID=UPI002D790884|nr:uncharacterized protein LOC133863105 [Alnus glutinosa]